MASFIDTIKAILTRLIFAAHGLVAIYKAVSLKDDPWYWYLAITILLLCFEGVFTLTIKETQEWKWFCPSVFLYLASVCPSIWLIELDKLDTRLAKKNAAISLSGAIDITTITEPPLESTESPLINALNVNFNSSENATSLNQTRANLDVLKNVGIPLDLENIPIQVDNDTLVVIIEQFLMLILIIGRWMLPKGDLTRDQLSQLLLVYIGTAADIIEFFDSFKDEKVNTNKVLCVMVLSIWSWSLLQFTFVLTATKGRKTRITQEDQKPKKLERAKEICCSIDVWGILINIILQDAPFFVFRVMLIAYYRLISYMNIFFTCKNTLVITLQFYRLFVVQLEKKEAMKKEEEAAKKKLMKRRVMKPDLLPQPTRPKRSGGGGSASKGERRNKSPKEPRSTSKEKRSRIKESGSSGINLAGGGNSNSKLSSADSSRQSRGTSSGRNKTFSTEDGGSMGSNSPAPNRVRPNDRRRKAGMLAQKSSPSSLPSVTKSGRKSASGTSSARRVNAPLESGTTKVSDCSSQGWKYSKVPNGSSGTPSNMKKKRSKTVDLDNDAGVMNDLEGESDGQGDPMDEEVDIIELHVPPENLNGSFPSDIEEDEDGDEDDDAFEEDVDEEDRINRDLEEVVSESSPLSEVDMIEIPNGSDDEDSGSGILMMELPPSRCGQRSPKDQRSSASFNTRTTPSSISRSSGLRSQTTNPSDRSPNQVHRTSSFTTRGSSSARSRSNGTISNSGRSSRTVSHISSAERRGQLVRARDAGYSSTRSSSHESGDLYGVDDILEEDEEDEDEYHEEDELLSGLTTADSPSNTSLSTTTGSSQTGRDRRRSLISGRARGSSSNSDVSDSTYSYASSNWQTLAFTKAQLLQDELRERI